MCFEASLYHYQAQHPQVFMSALKEPKFFALEGHPLDFRGPGDERIRAETTTTLEAYRRLFHGVRAEIAIGERHLRLEALIGRHLSSWRR